MIILFRHTVPENQPDQRLSEYARGRIPAYPTRKGLKKAIKRGELTVNGKPGETGCWVRAGDEIALIKVDRTPPSISRRPLDIVFQDSHLAVVNKPPGLPVSGNYYPTLENVLVGHFTKSAEPDAWSWPHPAHRLDAPTSGLLIVALTRSSEAALREAFGKRLIKKRYHAVVMGSIPEQGIIETPIDGKDAKTTYLKLREVQSIKNGTLSLVKLHPHTGRTHQLRKHMAEIGHPILGDRLYGIPDFIFKGEGLFLCATGLQFSHPVSGLPLTFSIPPPQKFEKRMQKEQTMWERKNLPQSD